METEFFRFMGMLIYGPLAGSLPFDLPMPVAAGLSALELTILCSLVVVIGAVAFFVIRAIKKNQAGRNRS